MRSLENGHRAAQQGGTYQANRRTIGSEGTIYISSSTQKEEARLQADGSRRQKAGKVRQADQKQERGSLLVVQMPLPRDREKLI